MRVVDTDAELTSSITLEKLHAITWWNPELVKKDDLVQYRAQIGRTG